MLNKIVILGFIWSITWISNTVYAQQNSALSTLFTTSEERKLIDANRYKQNQQVELSTQIEASPEVETTDDVIEEVTVELTVSGFTLSQNGQNVAWINGKPYQNGSTLEDGSKLIVSDKSSGVVQIKTPDGQYHRLSTGKSAVISYQKPPEKG